jgi:hypothetical protein
MQTVKRRFDVGVFSNILLPAEKFTISLHGGAIFAYHDHDQQGFSGGSIMEADKSQDLVPSAVNSERNALVGQTQKPASTPVQQMELNEALDEMAEIIEAEGGVLTP